MSDVAHTGVGRALHAANRIIGLGGLSALAVVIGLADAIARAPAGATGVATPMLAPSPELIFGSDALGRDLLSETLHGLATSAGQAALAALVAIAVGGLGGFLAARLPWRTGEALRWLAGVASCVPALALLLLFIGIAGRSYAAIATGLAIAPQAFARSFDRGLVLASSRHAEFARATGIASATLIRRDLVYEIRNSFLAIAGRALASAAILLSTVGFFGFGAVPPHRDLGSMVGTAFTAARAANDYHAWWTVLFPALALILLIFFARLAASTEDGSS
jgi:peptide/nickel transport system permease protein